METARINPMYPRNSGYDQSYQCQIVGKQGIMGLMWSARMGLFIMHIRSYLLISQTILSNSSWPATTKSGVLAASLNTRSLANLCRVCGGTVMPSYRPWLMLLKEWTQTSSMTLASDLLILFGKAFRIAISSRALPQTFSTNFTRAYLKTISLPGQQSTSVEAKQRSTDDFAQWPKEPICAISRKAYP